MVEKVGFLELDGPVRILVLSLITCEILDKSHNLNLSLLFWEMYIIYINSSPLGRRARKVTLVNSNLAKFL